MEELGFKIKVDSGDGEKSVKSFKQELKEARENVVNMSRSFGELSPQAIKAAQDFSKLREEIADANELTTALTDEKRFAAFANFGSSIAGGFEAAQGVISLTAGKSKELEAALLKVQSAMALSQGLASVADLPRQYEVAKAALGSFTIVQKVNSAATEAAAVVQKLFAGAVNTTSTSFKVLRGAIIATGIGALVAIIGYVIANFDKLKETLFNLIPGLKSVADFFGSIVEKVTDFVGATSDATREAGRLKDAIENQNAAHDKNIQLLEASGAAAKDVRAAKMAMYQDEMDAIVKLATLNGKHSEEDLKRFNELIFQRKLLNAQQAKDDRDAAEKAAKDADEDHKKALEKQKQNAKEVSEQRKKDAAEEAAEQKKLSDGIVEALKSGREKLIGELQSRHEFEIKLLQAQGKETTALRAQQIDEEIALMQQLGKEQLPKIAALEEEKVLAAATAKKAAEDKLKEEEKKHQEELKGIQTQLDEDADAARADSVQKELDHITAKYDAMRAIVGNNEALLTQITTAEAKARTEATKKWDDITAENKRKNLSALANIFGGFSKLVGQNTAAGKGFAIAQATIDTYQGATAALAATAKLPFIGVAMGIANAALIVANGIKNVKEIVKTKVPNVADSSGSSAPTLSATTAAASGGSPAVNTAPTLLGGIQSTLMQQTKELSEGKDALKAYVVESEVTQKQERNRAITESANF